MSVNAPTALEPTTADPHQLPHQEPEQKSKKTRSRSRWWLWVLLLVLLGLSGYRLLENRRQKQAADAKLAVRSAPQSVPVSVAPARNGDIPVYLNGLGSVAAFNTVTVRSRIDGQLVKVAFREGQFVHRGDLLAEIDPRPFEVQLEQAEGQLARDQAQLNNAKVDLARYQTLFEQDSIARQQLDTQAATVGQFEGAIKADQAMVNNARLQLTYSHITAPISGRVGLRLVDAGNMVHASDTNGLLIITQVEPIAILFTIPEDNLPAVLKRLRAGGRLPVEAYERSGKTKIATGYLLTVDNQIDPSTGTSRLKAVFQNHDNALFPNQFVNVRLLLEIKRGKVIVPIVAIQRGPQGTFVYAVKADKTVEVRPVTVGPAEGNDASIESGLSVGDVVVVDGMDKLQAGSKVRVQSSDKANSGRRPGA
jgi:membrane fusion protein, multidrug efflux system